MQSPDYWGTHHPHTGQPNALEEEEVPFRFIRNLYDMNECVDII
jgi:hypothetical protein